MMSIHRFFEALTPEQKHEGNVWLLKMIGQTLDSYIKMPEKELEMDNTMSIYRFFENFEELTPVQKHEGNAYLLKMIDQICDSYIKMIEKEREEALESVRNDPRGPGFFYGNKSLMEDSPSDIMMEREQPDLDLSGESKMYSADPLKFFEKLCGAYEEIAKSLIPKEILDGMRNSKSRFEGKYGGHISKYIQETGKGEEENV